MNQTKKLLNIPNLLSLFRLLLIPLILWLYCRKQACGWALAVLLLSAATDIADGYIARRFGQITDLGKVLDPVADKLTQIATLWCLVSRFSHMWIPLVILMAKELFTGIMGLYAVKKSGIVKGADWHGKLCTAFLYGVMGLHFLWAGIPKWLSMGLMGLSVLLMLFSGILYWYRNLKQIKGYE